MSVWRSEPSERGGTTYVPSASNIADGGSREGVTDPVAAAAGISLRQVDFPMSLRELIYAKPAVWAAHW